MQAYIIIENAHATLTKFSYCETQLNNSDIRLNLLINSHISENRPHHRPNSLNKFSSNKVDAQRL